MESAKFAINSAFFSILGSDAAFIQRKFNKYIQSGYMFSTTKEGEFTVGNNLIKVQYNGDYLPKIFWDIAKAIYRRIDPQLISGKSPKLSVHTCLRDPNSIIRSAMHNICKTADYAKLCDIIRIVTPLRAYRKLRPESLIFYAIYLCNMLSTTKIVLLWEIVISSSVPPRLPHPDYKKMAIPYVINEKNIANMRQTLSHIAAYRYDSRPVFMGAHLKCGQLIVYVLPHAPASMWGIITGSNYE